MELEILSLRNVSLSRLHSAFPDLTEWNGRYWCAYREGPSHTSYEGRVIVLVSDDLERWEFAGLVTGLYLSLIHI